MSTRNVVHIEIPAGKQDVASNFYSEMFGWKITPMPEMEYTMWETENGLSGGFPSVSNESPAGQVTVYIDSDDIEADLAKIKKLGGKVIHPNTEIPGMGWFAMFQDPTGNVLALYTGKNPG